MKFVATPEKGEVSALLMRPEDATSPARPGPRGEHEHAARDAANDRRPAGRRGYRDVSLQFSVLGARQGARLSGGLHRDRTTAVAARTRAPGSSAPGGRPFFRRADDLDRRFGGAARERPRAGLLLLPAASAGWPDTKRAEHLAGHESRCSSSAGRGTSWRSWTSSGPSASGSAKLATLHAAGDRRPRLQGPQEVSHERRGCLRRDGSRRQGMGVEAAMRPGDGASCHGLVRGFPAPKSTWRMAGRSLMARREEGRGG